MSKLSRKQSDTLLGILREKGSCIAGNSVNMTPSTPNKNQSEDPVAHERYKQQKLLARLTCESCVVNEACFIYSRDVMASPIYAAGLEKQEQARLARLFFNQDLLGEFVELQESIHKPK